VWIIDPTVGALGLRPEHQPTPTTAGENPNRAKVVRSNGEVGAIGEGARHAPLQGMSLGAFIGGFKSSVTSRASRELQMANIWQRNYYEHVARNEAEIRGFWDYIDDNPRKWEDDKLHPSAPSNKFNQE
jgi:hypothetical protein